jgi:NADPH:quinone reductase-like Zn-dependent oxidoreductase
MSDKSRPPKVLAVSSGGGHWSELRRLHPAWAGARVDFMVTDAGYRQEVARDAASGGHKPRAFRVMDANATQKLRLLGLAVMTAWVVLRVRPDVVISTGAAPGYFAIRFAKMMGARTVWIDSIANAEELSVSANLARRHCTLWLTQWPHLQDETGAHYAGAVL